MKPEIKDFDSVVKYAAALKAYNEEKERKKQEERRAKYEEAKTKAIESLKSSYAKFFKILENDEIKTEFVFFYDDQRLDVRFFLKNGEIPMCTAQAVQRYHETMNDWGFPTKNFNRDYDGSILFKSNNEMLEWIAEALMDCSLPF